MKLRGAISGFGEVAALAHLPGWLARGAINISVVHEPVSARRHEAMRLIKNVRVYDDLELMLDGEALDFVDIASPPALHGAAARVALEADAHVLVEKPMCLTLAEFDALRKLAADRRRVLMCVHNWKYAPAYALARRMIDEGRLGAVQFVSLDRIRTEPAGARGAGGAWRAASASGGGILIDHGWHVFYLMQWLFGGDAPVGISAALSSREPGAGEDLADLRVSFSSGRSATSHLSWRGPARRTSAMIRGDLGSLEIEGDRVSFTDRLGRIDETSVADLPDDSYHRAWFAAMAEEFERAIAAGPGSGAARVNLAEARNAIALMSAARKSASDGGVEVKITA
ncbi:MAG TPA: Gfo/Idh/MocA family oxidoreductase [Candidatus Binataceae bacterium]|nr:Gfo/Idh/MocA family oxidoreductase [Candidatus Binataceae bacterium]